MDRLFLFCIGGTGARVLRSLVHLLAAGVELPVRELIPIIIDPDKENGNVEQSIKLLNAYQEIRDKAHSAGSSFFNTSIRRLSEVVDGDIAGLSNEFRAGAQTGERQTFKDFLEFDSMDAATRSLLQLLYSERNNLQSDLSIGFKGNPHMGTVVLNKFQESADFRAFVNMVSDNDRIFIVSSIFGGTGAAGFPLLVKNIRHPHSDYQSKQATLKQLPLGALSMLPYFGVESKPGSPIQNTFMGKTKAALSFYGDDLRGINSLYYLGDDKQKEVDNQPGGASQQNRAHFAELVAALAVIDFAKMPQDKLKTNAEGIALQPSFKEFGLLVDENNPDQLSLRNLASSTRQQIGPHLIKMYYALLFAKNQLAESLATKNHPFVKGSTGVPLSPSLINAPFFADRLNPYFTQFHDWLIELAQNSRAFAPFNLQTEALDAKVVGVEQLKKGFFRKTSDWDYAVFEGYLNDVESNMGGLSAEQKLLALLSQGTEELYKERIQTGLLG